MNGRAGTRSTLIFFCVAIAVLALFGSRVAADDGDRSSADGAADTLPTLPSGDDSAASPGPPVPSGGAAASPSLPVPSGGAAASPALPVPSGGAAATEDSNDGSGAGEPNGDVISTTEDVSTTEVHDENLASAMVEGMVSADDNVVLSETTVEGIAEELGIPADEVVERLAGQQAAASVEANLSNSLGDDFAGAWLDDDGKLHVGIVDPARADAVEAAGAVAEVVEFSADQLNAVVDELNAAVESDAELLAAATGWWLDPVTNRIVVETDDEPGIGSVLASLAIDPGIVRYMPAKDYLATDNTFGGERYWTPGSGCSWGFAVTGGVITAGHCAGVGARVRDQALNKEVGAFEQSVFGGIDGAFIRFHSGHQAQPFVSQHNGSYGYVFGGNPGPVGASICRSGATTGLRCGKITTRTATVNVGGRITNNQIITTACASPGDSGGALMWGNHAQGVTSAASRFCNQSGPHTSIFQPIGPLLSRWGLSLTVARPGTPVPPRTGNPPPSPPPPGNPPPPPPPDGSVTARVVVVGSGKCLTAERGNATQQNCNGSAAQRWTATPMAGGQYQLSTGHGKCLDVADGRSAAGSNVIDWTCHRQANQMWTAEQIQPGTYVLHSANGGRCLDVFSGVTGTNVGLWDCHRGGNQQWRFEG